MSEKDDNEEDVARLERLNEELSKSLKRCRSLLHDYEARLAANSNEARTFDDEEETRKGVTPPH
jgi:hypothetical protein